MVCDCQTQQAELLVLPLGQASRFFWAIPLGTMIQKQDLEKAVGCGREDLANVVNCPRVAKQGLGTSVLSFHSLYSLLERSE